MRLVDAEDGLSKFPIEFPGVYTTFEIHEMIGNTPTVEAAPVACGKWIDLSKDADQHFMCSTCSASLDIEYTDTRYPYCPNCGAKMQ